MARVFKITEDNQDYVAELSLLTKESDIEALTRLLGAVQIGWWYLKLKPGSNADIQHTSWPTAAQALNYLRQLTFAH